MNPLKTESKLFQFIQTDGWDLTVSRTWIWLKCPSRREFIEVQEKYGDVLQAWTAKYLVFLSHPSARNLLRIPTKGNVMATSFQYAELATIRLTPSLLRVIDDLLSNPRNGGGLVRLADEKQVCMPESNGPYLMGLKLEEAVQLHRKDFWHAEDLEEFRRLSRQRLEPDNPDSSLIFTFRSFDPEVGDPQLIDSTFTNEYRLVSDGLGNLYHITQHLGMEVLSM